MSTPRIVLPVLAAIALVAMLWLAFHDSGAETPGASPATPAVAPGR